MTDPAKCPAPLIPAPLMRSVPTPIRVAYLIDSLGPGGAEHLLATYLGHLLGDGVDATVVVFHQREGNPIAEDLRRLGVPVLDLGIRRLRQPGAYRRVADLLDDLQPDLVHTQLEFANVLGSIAAHRRGIPTVSTLHTLDRPPRASRAGLRFRLMSWVLRRYARRVIAVSESARIHHLATARLRPEQVITIHNGIDLARFTTSPGTGRQVRRELGIPDEVPLVLTIAVLREPKGIQYMLGALRRLLPEVPDARYLVVGDGEHRSRLEALAGELGITDRVVFAGHRSDVHRVLAAADVFVLPTLTEALPTVLAEAMAASVPTVVTAVGGIPEMVVPDHSTLVVEPCDEVALAAAVGRLLRNPVQAAAMGRAGRRLAEARFDLRRQAAELVEEYRFLIGGGGR